MKGASVCVFGWNVSQSEQESQEPCLDMLPSSQIPASQTLLFSTDNPVCSYRSDEVKREREERERVVVVVCGCVSFVCVRACVRACVCSVCVCVSDDDVWCVCVCLRACVRALSVRWWC